VSKAALGQYRDLGLYVTEQLKQIIDRELARLKETQMYERRNVTQKVVATAYGGLVGRFLDSSTETLPGYVPVVKPPVPPPSPPTPPSTPTPPAQEPPPSQPTTPQGDTEPPVVQVLGDNPARVVLGGVYQDLGAVATDNVSGDLAVKVFLNGNRVPAVVVDTSRTGTWFVRYEATDVAGNTGVAERTIDVYDPGVQQTQPSNSTGGSSGGGSSGGGSSGTTTQPPPSSTTTPTSSPATTTPPTPPPPPATTTPPAPPPAPTPPPEPASTSSPTNESDVTATSTTP